MTIRVAVITDIHHGKDAEAKKGSRALPLLAEFATFVADAKPDLVLDLGDRISDEDPETDLRLEKEVHAALAPVRDVAPLHHICGNHDRDFLTVAQNETVFGQPLKNQTIDIGGWRLVLFRADTLIRRPGGFHCPDADIAWLADVARQADRPLLIASHVPFSGHSQIGNYYFERNAGSSTYPQADRLRAALRHSRVPTACIAGHVHWNTWNTVDGIPHMTQQSLTESYVMAAEVGTGDACGAMGLIELSDEGIDWRVFGHDACRVTVPLAQMGRRWYPPLQPFEQIERGSERVARLAAFQAARQDIVL